MSNYTGNIEESVSFDTLCNIHIWGQLPCPDQEDTVYFKQVDEIVSGRKVQTRRIVKPGEAYLFLAADGRQYKWTSDNGSRHANELETILEVYNRNMHRLKWRVGNDYAVSPGRGKPGAVWRPEGFVLTYTREHTCTAQEWTSAHLARGWQPLRIVITAIRREPLQAITEEDAVAEGVESPVCTECDGTGKAQYHVPDPYGLSRPYTKLAPCYVCGELSPVDAYRELWEQINGGGSWDANPDVWVITFEVKR